MKKPVFFDHIEIHVRDIKLYCEFLQRIFQGGRYKALPGTDTCFFKTDEGLCFEIKKRADEGAPIKSGFCLPCLRTERAEAFITQELGFRIESSGDNPDGKVFFFKDHEGITWHIKDHLKQGDATNW